MNKVNEAEEIVRRTINRKALERAILNEFGSAPQPDDRDTVESVISTYLEYCLLETWGHPLEK